MVHISSSVLTTPINFISTISIADFLEVLLPFYNPSSGSLRLLLLLLLPSLPTPLRAILGIWKAAFCNYTTPGSSSRLATRQPLRPMFSRLKRDMRCWGKCQDHISTWTIRSTEHRRLFLFLNAKHETSFQAVGFVFKRVGIKLFRISIDFEHWTGVDISLNIADFIYSCKVTNISMVIYKTVSSKWGCYDLIIRWWRYVQVQVLLFVDVIFFLYEYLSIINVLHRSERKF